MYQTLSGSFWFIFDMLIGKFDRSYFHHGKDSQAFVLNGLFLVSSFSIKIVMLNMLIGMMANTYEKRKALVGHITSRNHLRFVVDNFHLVNSKFFFGDKQNMSCI